MRLLFFMLLAGNTLFAAQPEWLPEYSVSYLKDSISKGKGARLKFVCSFESDYDPHRTLRYGIDGSDVTVKLDKNDTYEFMSSPGAHVFQFFYDLQFKEITTDSIEVIAGKITVISLHFKGQYETPRVKKPVIYFYPESETELAVQLKPAGNLTFTYPDYTSGWNGTAHPDGAITIKGKQYPYLFWESEQQFNTFDLKIGGFLVPKENVVELLEKQLAKLGFNDKEKADFITFWGPQLQQHKQVMIQFILNDACNQFAELKINPEPRHLNRVYMVWYPVNAPHKVFLKPQELNQLNRNGFDVLEWGGIELTNLVN